METQDQSYTLQDVASLFRRRWRLLGAITLACFLTSAIVAYSLGNLYRSFAEIDIQCPEVPDPLMRGGTCGQIDRSQRIDRLNDEVMSRDNLAALIEKHDLYAEIRGDRPAAAVVREMRPNIDLALTLDDADPRNKRLGEVMGFTVSYYYSDPRKTRDVTRDLASLFVRASAERSDQAVASAAGILQAQVDRLKTRLQEQEARRTEFKERNPGAMPEDRNFNRQQLLREKATLESVDRQIRDLDGQLQLITSQIANTEPYITTVDESGNLLMDNLESCRAVQTRFRDLLARYSPQHPDVVQARRQLEQVCTSTGTGYREAIELQLTTRRAELAELERGLPAENPDVRRLRRIVSSLEQDLANAPPENRSRPPDNPVYVQLAIRQQSLEAELGALRGRREALNTQIASLESRVAGSPAVERELTELTRGYEQAKKAFEEAERRLIDLGRERLSETWVLHKAANLPFVPAFPNRPLIMLVGLVLGLSLAAIVVLILEAVDGTVRGTRDVRNLLEMPPIAAVPFVATSADLARARTRRVAGVFGTVLAVVLTGAYVYVQRGGFV